MKNFLLTALLALAGLSGAHATNYYVSASGGTNTTANGTGLSPTNAFATIQYAADRAQTPGDVVYIRAGTYITTGSSLLYVKYSGSAGAPIIFRNYPGDARPLLQFSGYYGVYIGEDVSRPGLGVSYIEVLGLRLQGNNRNILLADALNQTYSCANPTGGYDARYQGSGIVVKGTATIHPHHIRMADNEIFECPGGGMGAARADYITIENNLVYNTAWYTNSGGSGISVLGGWDFDTRTDIYRTIIRNNRCFGNELRVPWFSGGVCKGYTDGNGIIVDSNRNFGYTGRTLIANNLVGDNGGAGITFFQSDHGDIINNTLYHNVKTATNPGGDLVIAYASDVLAQNNIAVAATKYTVQVKYASNVTLNANLFFGGTGVTLTNNNTGTIPNTNAVVADPQFVSPGTDPFGSDFTLNAGSPAIDRGVNNLLSATDLAGNPRVAGSLPDLGAYERAVALAAKTSAETPAALEVYPNPSVGPVVLRYTTASTGPVRLEVLDGLGRCVALLVDGEQPAGAHEEAFRAPARAAGLYHVLLTTPAGRVSQALSLEQ
ncbi:right-handed parallel beta-helix repeat-containing protein [Hymenobacter terricola]|uniref:right-handed parallel beta-helix repeat-containing protein n=1 Tax=Hymenobacter terricola TaxID=2819236 RepID=UPI001B314F08|nr:right-handed parallel beta-helix repeat-containing protein [Hymenobacter terricola]